MDTFLDAFLDAFLDLFLDVFCMLFGAHFWTICWRLLLIFSNASVNTIMEAFRRLLGTLFGNVLTYFVFKYVFFKTILKIQINSYSLNTQLVSILFHSQTLNYKLDLVGGRFLRINQVVDRVEHRTTYHQQCQNVNLELLRNSFHMNYLRFFFSRILLAIGV